jgi:hypothetical protein
MVFEIEWNPRGHLETWIQNLVPSGKIRPVAFPCLWRRVDGCCALRTT